MCPIHSNLSTFRPSPKNLRRDVPNTWKDCDRFLNHIKLNHQMGSGFSESNNLCVWFAVNKIKRDWLVGAWWSRYSGDLTEDKIIFYTNVSSFFNWQIYHSAKKLPDLQKAFCKALNYIDMLTSCFYIFFFYHLLNHQFFSNMFLFLFLWVSFFVKWVKNSSLYFELKN